VSEDLSKIEILNEFTALSMTVEGTRQERTAAFCSGELLDAILGVISSGVSLRDACAIANIAYSTVQKKLTNDPALLPLYEGARVRQAEAVLDDIERVEQKVEFEGLDPRAAQVLIGSKQWRAERLNPKRYGPRSFQHIETVDSTQLHLEAVRQLARERREALTHQPAGAQVPVVIDGEFEVVQPGPEDGVDR
jgi:hypothetical protein